MEIFEIHITGNESINDELDKLNIKNIIVELLTPKNEIIRTEYMSSFIYKCESYIQCKEYVNNLLSILKSDIIRVKIESPYYEHYKELSLYMESHFLPKNIQYPISRNRKSGKLMGTDRVYNKLEYDDFMKKWNDSDFELCLYDTFIEEDFDWFEKYTT